MINADGRLVVVSRVKENQDIAFDVFCGVFLSSMMDLRPVASASQDGPIPLLTRHLQDELRNISGWRLDVHFARSAFRSTAALSPRDALACILP
jgi:hypothetical protein